MNTSNISNFGNDISSTAFIASLCRQFTNIPYTKEFAKLVETQGLVNASLSQHVSKAFVSIINLEARYQAINKLITELQLTQIIELASGLIPRGIIMSNDPNLTFVESDLSPLINYKEELVQQLIGRRTNLHFLEIDATNENQLMQASKHFNMKQPILIICEGLLMHLTRLEQQKMCANIHKMLSISGGVWITSDFTFTSGLKKSRSLLQKDSMLLPQIQGILDRTIISPDDEFETLEKARQFALEQGFSITKHNILNLIDGLSCLNILNIDASEAERIIAEQYVFVLTPNQSSTII